MRVLKFLVDGEMLSVRIDDKDILMSGKNTNGRFIHVKDFEVFQPTPVLKENYRKEYDRMVKVLEKLGSEKEVDEYVIEEFGKKGYKYVGREG